MAPTAEPTFEVAGEDGKYVPAKAVIEGNDVLVWSDAVKKPLSARHAWDSNPAVNLYNKEGLPATSLRTNKELLKRYIDETIIVTTHSSRWSDIGD